MRLSAGGWTILSIALGFPFALQAGCSAGGSGSKPFGGTSAGGSGNGTGTGSTPGSGSNTGSGNAGSGSGGIMFGNGGTGSSGTAADSSACQPIVSQPEQRVTYVDATVTDTIYTYSPVAIYIMQDRSSSMVGYLGTGDPNSWPNSQAAVGAFVDDPNSSGLLVGLGAFPPYPSNDGSSNCAVNCDTPIVPIAALPGNAAALKNAYTTASPANTFLPLFTPTECGLNGMIDACNAFRQQPQNAGIECVGLLITDGQPTECNGDINYLSGLLSTAATNGMKTFVLGLPGSNITTLNQFAQAGGTGTAIDLTGGTSVTAIIDALNTIRTKVASAVSSQVVTTQSVISTPLPCEWNIQSTIDRTMTNLEYKSATVTTPETLGHIKDDLVTSCGTEDAWYYDVPAPGTPTRILLCPATCDKVKADTTPTMSLIFGCPTTEIIR